MARRPSGSRQIDYGNLYTTWKLGAGDPRDIALRVCEHELPVPVVGRERTLDDSTTQLRYQASHFVDGLWLLNDEAQHRRDLEVLSRSAPTVSEAKQLKGPPPVEADLHAVPLEYAIDARGPLRDVPPTNDRLIEAHLTLDVATEDVEQWSAFHRLRRWVSVGKGSHTGHWRVNFSVARGRFIAL